MKITEYQLLFGDSADDLASEVDDALSEGWQPFGSPYGLVLAEWDSPSHYQAMVKYAE